MAKLVIVVGYEFGIFLCMCKFQLEFSLSAISKVRDPTYLASAVSVGVSPHPILLLFGVCNLLCDHYQNYFSLHVRIFILVSCWE